jgi:O-antigen ligase
MKLLFGSSFDSMAVAGHLLFGFYAIWVLFKNCSKLFKLNTLFKSLLFLVLLFPYFYPIEIAVNLTSEGIAYPLYLLLVSFLIDLLFRNQDLKIIHLSIAFVLLVLTRGQFVIIAPIVALLYLLKMKKEVLKKRKLFFLIIFLLLPLISGILDKTYRYVFYGFFETTPYSYVNAITLPLFVSGEDDYKLFSEKDYQQLYIASYHRLDSMKLLSSKVDGSYNKKYEVFHNNFPKICNQNIHQYGMAYYRTQSDIPSMEAFKIELACKEMFPILITHNFYEWAVLYITGIIHGFKSVFILFFVMALAFLSFWKAIKKFTLRNGFVLMATLFILSNAMVVAIASHSIMRYLFYNYFFGLLIIILLLKKFTTKNES